MPGPLEGIRILDLSVALTGPLATGMLVDQGASCVKVEQAPTGDLIRWIGTSVKGISAMFQVANRGKRSIVLDIRREEGKAILSDLVVDADVLVQNFRPGVAERLGVAYSDMAALKPDLIYADLTGYGPSGPYSHRRVYDTAIQAQSGLTDNQTGLYDQKPHQLRQLAADKITAYTASQAITAALFARQNGAGGQHIQLSMLDACIAFLFVDGADHEVILDGDHSGPQSVASQVTPVAFSDGHVAIAAPDDTGFHGMAAAFGVDSSDPDVATAPDRARNREKHIRVHLEVHASATNFTVEEAEELLEANNVPFGTIRRVDEVPTDPQVIANGLFVEHDHPAAGRVRQHRPPAQFLGTPTQMTEPSAPTLGQHTDQVVAETGRGDEVARLREAGVIA
ncbi:MAG TPA: CoA transferase [Acidimicrobiales bacterium]|jgi:crotonobetainyl-CoA:carnitine CoA-transferase CaiB-like acyl-CoA transferase|nr:CoA transferase [Acidimicrobiales bacterium]MDP7117602.1 CoA transferase [Acidimicrobiales bacterium]MDP7411141.1 CoA transferase [Acidimicrobiales bacterium]MEE1522206.1 CoA transferase [Acidimicrobiales bacterium]MEE1571172.1 CoA transferase [Acidimicrobiales bacterium]|tara:strand:- start:6276 stop:7463 length:1188 start_codon:yes stop_codon:yes gene_type:complete